MFYLIDRNKKINLMFRKGRPISDGLLKFENHLQSYYNVSVKGQIKQISEIGEKRKA